MPTTDETDKQPAMPYRLVMDKLDAVAAGQQKLEISFAKLEASVTPRHEIVQEVEKRVSLSMYLADKEATSQRISKLEAAPQSVWNKASILVASGIGCLSVLLASVGVFISLMVATGVWK